jgi:hypothetical protein
VVSWIVVTMPLVEVIVSTPLTVTTPVVRVFIVSVVAALLVESEVTRSVTFPPVLVISDIVEKSRVLMSVYSKMVEAVPVPSDIKVVSSTVVPLVAMRVVSKFVFILSFVKFVMVFILVDMFSVLVLDKVNIVIVASMP